MHTTAGLGSASTCSAQEEERQLCGSLHAVFVSGININCAQTSPNRGLLSPHWRSTRLSPATRHHSSTDRALRCHRAEGPPRTDRRTSIHSISVLIPQSSRASAYPFGANGEASRRDVQHLSYLVRIRDKSANNSSALQGSKRCRFANRCHNGLQPNSKSSTASNPN